jgi:hypothetical protein
MTPPTVKAPTRPCGTCPYRRDVPSGIWHQVEYARLREYDAETWAQPVALFMCHQRTDRLCAGWVGVHNMAHSLAVRLASLNGRLTPDMLDRVLDYVSPVPLFRSGREAARHGMREIRQPGRNARRAILGLMAAHARRRAR